MISGIRMIRDIVIRLGTLTNTVLPVRRGFVQMLVDALRERTADPFHLRDLVDRRGLHAAQAAEMLDQRLAPLRADAGDLVEHGSGARFAAPRAMTDDGEAVRLVTDRLDEVQPGIRRRQLEGARLRLEDQLLEAGLALGAFRHADHADLVQAELDQRRARGAHLPPPAVDQHQVRNPARFGADALVAPPDHLPHRGVVVTRRDVADVEPPVLGFLHLLPIVYHAGADRGFPHCVADIEAFDALRAL